MAFLFLKEEKMRVNRICSLFVAFAFFSLAAHGQSAVPDGYYDGTDNLSGDALKLKLHQIIRNHTVLGYGEFRDTILPDLDEDPENANNLIVFYKNASVGKTDFNDENDFWNREHTWPSSHGFSDTSDSTYTDAHNLRPSDVTVNTSKSNKDFEDIENSAENEQGEAPDTYTNSDFWEPRDEIKGDVARILFYMDTRYESDRLDLKVVDRESYSGDPEIGVLSTLIQWHEDDPVDEYEINRHEGIYGYQGNRNPFIDHPEWVAEVFGSTSSPYLVVDELSFSRDFGFVLLGSSLQQQYSINAYNLTSDVSVEVEAPFAVSADGTNWSDSTGFENDASGEQTFTVYLRYEPTEEGQATDVEVLHYTESDTVRFNVEGQEGEQSTLSIAAARQVALGEVVQVTGVVIDAGNNNEDSRVLYDGTAGIVVRSFDAGNESANLVQGDSVEVSGALGDYNGLLQISESPITIHLLKSNATLPVPDTLLVDEVAEDVESQLVVVKEVFFQDAGSSFLGGGSAGNFVVEDQDGNELICRIGSSDHPLVGTTVPDGIYTITGFVGQFGDDYQISPRTEDDLLFVADNFDNGDDSLPVPDLSSIAAVRTAELDTRVQVTGVVISNDANSEYNRVIFDGTAGIVVRSLNSTTASSSLSIGDSVKIIGGIDEYQGTLQINEDPMTVEILAQNVSLPEAQEILVAEVSESYESELVKLSKLVFQETGSFERGDYTLFDGTNELTFTVGLSSHPLVGTEVPEDTVEVTGYIQEENGSYAILIRTLDDLVVNETDDTDPDDTTLGADKISDGWSVYPNPVSDYLQVEFSAAFGLKATQLMVLDLQGKLMLQTTAIAEPVDVSGFSTGMYMLRVIVDSVCYDQKFIKN